MKDKYKIQLWAFTFALLLPNIVMTFTEFVPWYTRIAQLLFGIGLYSTLMSLGRNPGRQFIYLFIFIFFDVFQLVLLWLYGRSPISVDMFLNLVSTNANEAGELLSNIIVGVIVVCTLYIGMIVWAIMNWRDEGRKTCATRIWPMLSPTLLCAILHCTTPFHFTRDVFPVNVSYNMGMAIYRYFQLSTYSLASSDFTFNATATHDTNEQETYIIVVGETARYTNFSLYGYERNTTPRLSARDNLLVYRDVLSQSNTTHKSVPMLLTAAEAADLSPMYHEKSVIAAFREAGFHTIYISNQADNGALIDLYSREADIRRYVRTDDRLPDDADLLTAMKEELDKDTHSKRLVVLHTYGGHFKYCERVPAEYRVFQPCEDKQLNVKNREDLLNAYDNTILYTDMVVDSLMTIADTGHKGSLFLVYTSDHGEDLYDDDRRNFLHASPIVSFYQIAVPFIILANDNYRAKHPDEFKSLQQNTRKAVSPGRDLFHTILGAAGIRCDKYRPDHALSDSLFCSGERLFLDDRNEARTLKQLHLTPDDFKHIEDAARMSRR